MKVAAGKSRDSGVPVKVNTEVVPNFRANGTTLARRELGSASSGKMAQPPENSRTGNFRSPHTMRPMSYGNPPLFNFQRVNNFDQTKSLSQQTYQMNNRTYWRK